MLVGGLWGLAMIGVWDVTFRLTWERLMNWVLPAAACAAATVLGAYRNGFLALLESAPLPRAWLKWPALAVLAVGFGFVLNYAVRYWDPHWPAQQISPAIIWLWPRTLYGALLLGPIWGSWAMLALPQFHRPDDSTDPHTRALARKTGPLATAVYLAVPLAGSFVYLMFLSPVLRFVPPAAALLAALGGGTLLVRLRGRLCREALLAANALTQSAFLLAYLVVVVR
jgi:hypothetical protein